jgi:sterol desaturase/sphingolipid hydroxylase (fatty acid hydroxylase superfamily)
VARAQGRPRYRFADAIADLGCGIGQRVTLLFYQGALVAAYIAVYKHARLLDLGRWPLLAWLVALLGVDLIYYWWHRASHRINVLWAGHVVHHQSEDYNLAVALRQSALSPITHMPFKLPLALIGIPPVVFVAAEAINTLYQFWIHTETVRGLGPLDAVLNTPTHHRVHHGANPRYLDKNYGGIFIIWDRLFGTFEPESEPVVYGITKPLRSFNPLWAQVHELGELAHLARRSGTLRGWVRAWLAPPERAGAATSGDAPAAAGKYDVPVTPRLRNYVIVNFGVAVAATFCLMMWQKQIPRALLVAGGALVLLTTATMSGLMEKKPWARRLEALRLGAAVAAGILVSVAAVTR